MMAARPRLLWLALLCGAIVAIAGCDSEAPGGYFPLQAGLTWQYQVTVESPGEKSNKRLTITNYGQLSDGSEYYLRGTSSGNYYYFSKRGNSVTRVAHRAIIDPELTFDEPVRPIIVEPMEVGAQWRYIMSPYLLTSETEPHLKDIRYEALWRVVSTDAVVDTPLGQFENCLHIRGSAEVEVPRSFLLHLAPHIMLFEINEWYAPDVGLVKLEYAETTDSKELKGGIINMNLVAFEF